jgi:hypothetical protein
MTEKLKSYVDVMQAETAWASIAHETYPHIHNVCALAISQGEEGTPLRAAYNAMHTARAAWETLVHGTEDGK